MITQVTINLATKFDSEREMEELLDTLLDEWTEIHPEVHGYKIETWEEEDEEY